MSIWFVENVSAIGDDEDLAKLLNIEVGHKDTLWSLGTIHLSAGMKNAPPFPLRKISKENPNIIFAVSSFCDTGGTYYRFLLLNGKHIPIDTIEDIFLAETKIGSHYDWADKLNYKETKNIIEKFKITDTLGNPIPINEDTEIGFLEPIIENKAP